MPKKGYKQTEEHRVKGGATRVGKHRSEETKAKISAANKGKTLSEETKAKLSTVNRGKTFSEETKAKMSERQKGKPKSKEHKAKLSESQKGRTFSEEHKAKLSAAMRGKTGALASNWQGGISFEPYCPLFNEELKERVRIWQDRRCLRCGKTEEENRVRLSVHHVEYEKSACCTGKPVCFAALCTSCHTKTNGDRDRWEAIFHHILDELYDGRSYYTKEEFQNLEYR
jgi:hypothetical protein